jgi:LuxR family maltose regulon positive regulatory protein
LTPITAQTRSVARRRACDAQPFSEMYVSRPELVGRMLGARDARLVLIVAPAGYGKSTLLAEWEHSDERRFVPIELWSAEAAAELALQRALDNAADQPAVFVIEDAHAAPSHVLRQVVTMLLARIGLDSQVALVSRVEPSLPIARLRAHRKLVEVRIEDLAMSPGSSSISPPCRRCRGRPKDGRWASTWRRCRYMINPTYAAL